MKQLTQNKKVLFIIIPLILLISIGGVYLWHQSRIEPTVVFKENIVFEYGEDIALNVLDHIDLDESSFDDVSTETLSCEESNASPIVTDEVGEHTVRIYATLKKKCLPFEMLYQVIDTQYPTLSNVKDLKITEGDEFNFDQFTAEDVIDGKVEVNIEGDYDVKTPGTYNLKAVAEDKNGNKTEKAFKLVIEEKEMEVVTTDSASNSSVTSNNFNAKPSSGNGNIGNSSSGNSSNITQNHTTKPETPKEPEKKPEPEKPKPQRPAYGTVQFETPYDSIEAYPGEWKSGTAEYEWVNGSWQLIVWMRGDTPDSVRAEYMKYAESYFEYPTVTGKEGQKIEGQGVWVFLGK